jgi:dihydrofolate reductase
MVFPVVLGAGKRLFGSTAEPAAMKLVDSKPAGQTVILTLVPA